VATDFGEIAVRSVQFTNGAGVAVDVDGVGLPTYSVTLPDLTAGTPPTVQHGALGEYWVNFISPQSGRLEDSWTGTVGGLTVKFGPDTFTVRPAAPGPIVSLADVRRHLRIRDLNPDRDELLRDYLDAATELCEDHTSRTYRRQTVVEAYSGGGCGLLLRSLPAQSITAVVESGISLTASDYTLAPATGILYRGTTAGGRTWRDGIENITVTYVAGATSVKAKVRLAVLELVRHLWDPQRGGAGLPRQAGAGDQWDPREGYAIPARVEELLDSDMGPAF
jgi:uncharacterized phiE125 gp8 family phage protein